MAKTPCSVDGCERKTLARNLCGTHYGRWKNGRTLDAPIQTKRPGALCEVPECGRKHAARGLCRTHFERKRQGIPLDTPVRELFLTDDLEARLRRYAPAGHPNQCWEWTRCKNKGYGMVSVGKTKKRGAHIVAWELATGRTLPDGMVIRHTCDNPPCTNPAHLIVGTHADNVYDRVEHGVPNKGVDNPQAKLTDDDVRAIRRLAHSGVSQPNIAAQFGITQTNVSMIVTRRTWKHL